MAIATDNSVIVVPGRVQILVAFPSAYTDLFVLGESEDSIQVRIRKFELDVPGDRYGGNSGPPTEKQFLGMVAEFELKMSRYDPAQVAKLENIGGLLSTNGEIPLASIGALMMATRGVRVLLLCTRDSTQTRNFPCCLWDQPITVGKQTKYSSCSMGVVAHRAPEGYWHSGSVADVWNTDTTGIT